MKRSSVFFVLFAMTGAVACGDSSTQAPPGGKDAAASPDVAVVNPADLGSVSSPEAQTVPDAPAPVDVPIGVAAETSAAEIGAGLDQGTGGLSDLRATLDGAAPIDLASGGSVDAGGGEGGAASLLGAPCTDNVTNAECQGPDTDYCAIQPGKAGYCTKSGCVTAADCPPNWTCFDLSKIGVPGYPPMCTKPAG